MSEAAFYNRRWKSDGMEASEAWRLNDLEREKEKAKLKRLLADSMLDKAAVKDLLAKNFDLRRQAGSFRLSPGMPRDERAAGAPYHRCRSQLRPQTSLGYATTAAFAAELD